MFTFHKLLAGDPTQFAITFTFGHLLSLASSFFLSGPKSQLKSMTHPTRRNISIAYVSMMIVTLGCALFRTRTRSGSRTPGRSRGGTRSGIALGSFASG